jgi:hypothetical protein
MNTVSGGNGPTTSSPCAALGDGGGDHLDLLAPKAPLARMRFSPATAMRGARPRLRAALRA